jgi:hypothetical protein
MRVPLLDGLSLVVHLCTAKSMSSLCRLAARAALVVDRRHSTSATRVVHTAVACRPRTSAHGACRLRARRARGVVVQVRVMSLSPAFLLTAAAPRKASPKPECGPIPRAPSVEQQRLNARTVAPFPRGVHARPPPLLLSPPPFNLPITPSPPRPLPAKTLLCEQAEAGASAPARARAPALARQRTSGWQGSGN